MLRVINSSSCSPELTSEDKLIWNEETDKNSYLLQTTKRVQDLSLLSGSGRESKGQETGEAQVQGLEVGKLSVSAVCFSPLGQVV